MHKTEITQLQVTTTANGRSGGKSLQIQINSEFEIKTNHISEFRIKPNHISIFKGNGF